MATKYDLQNWVFDALVALGGEATLVAVARNIWSRHEQDLRSSGDLFYTWQYDMRWAAQTLRDTGRALPAKGRPRGVWAVSEQYRPRTSLPADAETEVGGSSDD
jgi:hypothetical protein